MPPATRHLSLDLARGIAVMGILLINIVSFAMPGDAYIHPLAWGGTRATDLAVWTIDQWLFDGRMRGLFALLFGASALLVTERSETPLRTHYPRMAVLALFGLAHGYLVWNGDILLHYAVLGCVLPLVRRWDAGALARLALVMLAAQTAIWSLQFGGALYFQSLAKAPGAPADLVAKYRAMLATFPQPGSPTIAADLAAYRGSYGDAVAYRWHDRGGTPLRLLEFNGGESLGYMLLGMALYRSGALTGGWSSRALRTMLGWGYGVGLIGMAVMVGWAWASGFDPIVLMGNFVGWSIPFRVASTLGHLALILLIARRFAGRTLIARIAAAGRMAFTNYLATSLVMTTVFYGYGGVLYGRIGRVETLAFVAAMWVAILLWSPFWLSRFRVGPLEWIWRSAARAEFQPIRKFANETH